MIKSDSLLHIKLFFYRIDKILNIRIFYVLTIIYLFCQKGKISDASNAELKIELVSLNEQLNNHKSNQANIEAKLDEASKEIARLNASVSEKRYSTEQTLKNVETKLNEENKKLAEKNQTLTSQIEVLLTQLNEKSQFISNLNKEQELNNEKVSQLNAYITHLQAELETQKERLVKIQFN